MNTVLLTGFEAFGGEPINPSWEMVKLYDKQTFDNIHIVARCLPCVFGASIETLEKAIIKVKPDIVICFGQAGGRAAITPERVAINIDDARICDNAGKQPIDEAVIADAQAAYFSTLPIKAIVASLSQHGIPSAVSNTAGTFVCNHVFFGLQHLAKRYGIRKSGFVHIPYLPQQTVLQPNDPSMSLPMLRSAVQIIVKTTVITDKDSKLVGGAIQ